MTFRDINENRPVMAGHFGSERGREVVRTENNTKRHRRNSRNFQIPRFETLSAERWVDIICTAAISMFLISVFLNWNAFLDFLFIGVLFPIISVGAKLLGVIIGVGIVLVFLYAKLFGRRRWY